MQGGMRGHEPVHDRHHHRPPVEAVFAVIRDMSRTAVWTPGLTEGRQTSEGPLEPGATLVYRGEFLGRSYETPAVFTAFSENKQFATKSTAGPFYIEIDTTMEPVAAGTPGDQLLPGPEPRLLQVGRAARGPADQEAPSRPPRTTYARSWKITRSDRPLPGGRLRPVAPPRHSWRADGPPAMRETPRQAEKGRRKPEMAHLPTATAANDTACGRAESALFADVRLPRPAGCSLWVTANVSAKGCRPLVLAATYS